MKSHVLAAVNEALNNLKAEWGIDTVPSIVVEIPKNENFGDIATTVAMGLAPVVRKAPRKIAEDIVRTLENVSHHFQKIEIAGAGFINFTFNPQFFYDALNKIINQGHSEIDKTLGSGKRIQIEFVSANPTGPLHFGHGRGAAVGNALANLLLSAGYDVVKEFYINDAGRQVELLGQSVYAVYCEKCGHSVPFPEEGYRGDYIHAMADLLINEIGQKYADSNFTECRDFFITWSCEKMLERIRQNLQEFGVNFDNWQSEKELFTTGKVEETIKKLDEENYIEHKDGALWFRSSVFGDEKDRVIVKNDGTYTYFAPDIAYHKRKIEQSFDMLINIWGADHHGYISRLKAAIQALGFDSDKLKIQMVQLVNLMREKKPVQMSKRAGSFVTLKEVIDEVGVDTTKFIFLTRRPDSHLDFDLEAAKEQSSENPVFYVQYAHARINSIMRKAPEFNARSVDLTVLDKAEELSLMKKICAYPIIFEGAVLSLEPHRITYYLQELSARFHSYYNKYRVISDDTQLTQARLALCKAIQVVLKEGLEILGVHVPERM
jgi:arginyl-tRNA synthetase